MGGRAGAGPIGPGESHFGGHGAAAFSFGWAWGAPGVLLLSDPATAEVGPAIHAASGWTVETVGCDALAARVPEGGAFLVLPADLDLVRLVSALDANVPIVAAARRGDVDLAARAVDAGASERLVAGDRLAVVARRSGNASAWSKGSPQSSLVSPVLPGVGTGGARAAGHLSVGSEGSSGRARYRPPCSSSSPSPAR